MMAFNVQFWCVLIVAFAVSVFAHPRANRGAALFGAREAASAQSVVCPDDSYCPDGNTCCQLGGGQYGCCPFPDAVCCSDGERCCPNGYTCDVQAGTCFN